jgi:hypothetical protein
VSYGSNAYEAYVRIHLESGAVAMPSWSGLSHLGRMAWEAAAQAVAMAVLPKWLNPDPLEEDEDEDRLTDSDQTTDPPAEDLENADLRACSGVLAANPADSFGSYQDEN